MRSRKPALQGIIDEKALFGGHQLPVGHALRHVADGEDDDKPTLTVPGAQNPEHSCVMAPGAAL